VFVDVLEQDTGLVKVFFFSAIPNRLTESRINTNWCIFLGSRERNKITHVSRIYV